MTKAPVAPSTEQIGIKRNRECRACGSTRMEMVLDLGLTPLANSFLPLAERGSQEPRFPLRVYFCEECGHVQLLDVVPGEILFRDYIYVTSTSEMLRQHFAGMATDIAERQDLKSGDLVMEVASNDGCLQKEFTKRGVRSIGIEPADNVAKVAVNDGLEVVGEFFNLQLALELRSRYGPCRAIMGSNVMGHVDELRDFAAGLEHVLDDDGLVCFEVPHLLELVRGGEFDTIYHEHLSYFSLRVIQRVFAEAGLTLFDVKHMPVHGGTIRVFAKRTAARPVVSAELTRSLQEEDDAQLGSIETLWHLAAEVESTKRDLLTLLHGLKADGYRVASYGAAAKGNTLLNYFGIDTELIDYIVDRAPLKQGKLTPGAQLEVFPVEKLETDRPDYLLILAWNFADEIMAQQQAYYRAGGKFIIPLPHLRVVDSEHSEGDR
jgi:C-methyltransferase C-terminal domain/Putative zinc binding domain/Methyltransferase domain